MYIKLDGKVLEKVKENKKNKIDEAKNLAKNYNVDDYDKFKEERESKSVNTKEEAV